MRLYPPLNDAARQDIVHLSLEEPVTVRTVIDALVDRFGPAFRYHLYDDQGRIIPAWCVFVREHPIQLNSQDGLSTSVKAGDEIAFLLNLAGG